MTRPLFIAPVADPLPPIGSAIRLDGDEGHHAAVVRRIRAGEEIVVADGSGRGVRCRTASVDRQGLDLEVLEHLVSEPPAVRLVAVQGLAKGDRGELAVEMMTEAGVDQIRPWQATRSIVKWQGERGEKSRAKWQATARQAAKQSRRLRIPAVGETVSTKAVTRLVVEADLALVLHEDGTESLAAVTLPTHGSVVLVIGPEGGIAPEELAPLVSAGARVVTLGDGVLRTSTAGVVAVGHLRLRTGSPAVTR